MMIPRDSYLRSTYNIDWHSPKVKDQSQLLTSDSNSEVELIQKCFEFVRDQIKHSWDFSFNPVTCRASEVLEFSTGFCYAKAHLLAALLRAAGVPTGFCYQRLRYDDGYPGEGRFCLHGLNAVYLESAGWLRLDARGNKEGIHASFDPPEEILPFKTRYPGEWDLPEIWPEPLEVVVNALNKAEDIQDLSDNLPDIPVLSL